MARSSIDTAAENSIERRRISRSVAGVAFWTAVCLPFVQLSLLVGGLDSRRMVAAFGLLFVINVLALIVGHRYRRE